MAGVIAIWLVSLQRAWFFSASEYMHTMTASQNPMQALTLTMRLPYARWLSMRPLGPLSIAT